MIKISIKTKSKTEFIDITCEIQKVVHQSKIINGCCIVFIPHTTAGVTINENADPSVVSDILMIMNQIIPDQAPYKHQEGNSPAHIKTSLFGSSQYIPIEGGQLILGTWQGVFFCEFDGPRTRNIIIQMIGSN